MEFSQILLAFLALVFVLGLMFITLWLIKFCQQKGINYRINCCLKKGKRIKIIEHDFADYVEVIIEDDGPGIPDDRKLDAMRPFVRLDDARGTNTGGTGLGLSIAQTAIENHGGQMFLEDSELGGLRVKIVLPI